MSKSDGLLTHVGQEKSGIDAYFFDRVKLLHLQNDKVREEEDTENVELEAIKGGS